MIAWPYPPAGSIVRRPPVRYGGTLRVSEAKFFVILRAGIRLPGGLDPPDRGYAGFRAFVLETVRMGYEQRSERGFSRYTEGKLGQIGTFRRPMELHCRHLRDFSDSFSKQLSRKLVKVADT